MIDDYISEKILLADVAISQYCMKVINDGDVILVHAQYVCYLLIRNFLHVICISINVALQSSKSVLWTPTKLEKTLESLWWTLDQRWKVCVVMLTAGCVF